jgi:hypothetical protein
MDKTSDDKERKESDVVNRQPEEEELMLNLVDDDNLELTPRRMARNNPIMQPLVILTPIVIMSSPERLNVLDLGTHISRFQLEQALMAIRQTSPTCRRRIIEMAGYNFL